MKSNDTKEMLVNEHFTFKGYNETAKADNFIRRLRTYIANNGPDREIEYILIDKQIGKESYRSSNFELCKNMAMPIFEELQKDDICIPSFLEITVLARIIEFAPTFESAKAMVQKLFDFLEKEYSNEKKYKTVKWMVSFNFLPRLVREKYSSSLNTEEYQNEVKSLFEHHLKLSKDVSNRNGLPAHTAMLQLREGVFFTDPGLIDEGLTWLRSNQRSGWYSSAVNELLTYYTHLGDKITKSQLDILVGYRINKKREALNITLEDASEFLGITSSTLGQIETGRRGAKGIHLYKMSFLFGVDASYFFYDTRDEEMLPRGSDGDGFEAMMQGIRLNLQDATDRVRSQVSGIVGILTE